MTAIYTIYHDAYTQKCYIIVLPRYFLCLFVANLLEYIDFVSRIWYNAGVTRKEAKKCHREQADRKQQYAKIFVSAFVLIQKKAKNSQTIAKNTAFQKAKLSDAAFACL